MYTHMYTSRVEGAGRVAGVTRGSFINAFISIHASHFVHSVRFFIPFHTFVIPTRARPVKFVPNKRKKEKKRTG